MSETKLGSEPSSPSDFRSDRFTWNQDDGVLESLSRLKAQQRGQKLSSLYVNRPLLNFANFMNWAWKAGFKSCLEPQSLHVTVCFSRAPVDWGQLKPSHLTYQVEGGVRKVKELGTAIVMTFESPFLKARHAEMKSGGASFDFDSYTPHLTITYNKEGLDLLKLSEIEPYRRVLGFGEEVFEPIDEDWNKKVRETILDPNITQVSREGENA